MASTTTIDTTLVVPSVTINDLPDELLGHISILAGPTEYCTLRHALRRLWLYTTGREDHYHKHFLVIETPRGRPITTTLCGKRHSIFDRPAFYHTHRSYGAEMWYKYGKIHRDDDKPAEVWPDGDLKWFQHGERHRDNDKPAYTNSAGSQAWWQHGKKHRDNDKPAWIGGVSGKQKWYKRGVEYTPK